MCLTLAFLYSALMTFHSAISPSLPWFLLLSLSLIIFLLCPFFFLSLVWGHHGFPAFLSHPPTCSIHHLSFSMSSSNLASSEIRPLFLWDSHPLRYTNRTWGFLCLHICKLHITWGIPNQLPSFDWQFLPTLTKSSPAGPHHHPTLSLEVLGKGKRDKLFHGNYSVHPLVEPLGWAKPLPTPQHRHIHTSLLRFREQSSVQTTILGHVVLAFGQHTRECFQPMLFQPCCHIRGKGQGCASP